MSRLKCNVFFTENKAERCIRIGISLLKFSYQYIVGFMVVNNATEFATLNLMIYLQKIYNFEYSYPLNLFLINVIIVCILTV